MARVARLASVVFAGVLALSTLSGCDKLKSALGKGNADGGTVSAGAGATSGGGVLSFLGTDFEGEIAATVTTKTKTGAAQKASGPMQVVFGIKKPKYRIDVSGGAVSENPQFAQGGSIIIDPAQKKGWLLVPPQKMAMVIDFDKAKAMKGQIPGLPGAPKGATPTAPPIPSTPPKIEKTGKKDVVAGYSCEIWNITHEGKRAEICVAEGITWVDLSDLGMGNPELAIAAVAGDANRFPLRLVSYDAAGAEETRMQATKIDKKSLDDARFIVPPDYRVVDMAAMMSGLGNLGNLPKGPPHPVPAPRH
jgi:hypothetical protein